MVPVSTGRTPDVELWRTRNAAAVEKLYRSDYRQLVRRLTRMTRCVNDAEEVAQLAFVKLLESEIEISTLRSKQAFLFRIARNLAIDHIRHNDVGQLIFAGVNIDEAEQRGDLSHLASDAERLYASRNLVAHVDQALQDLSAKCRAIFIMSKANEKTYSEIALEMSLSISSVEKYMSRAIKHVKMQVGPEHLAA